MYGFIDKSVFEVMLNTCKNTEIPPKPSRNAVITRLIERFLLLIDEIVWIPFVISNNPVNIPDIKFWSMCKILKIGVMLVHNIFNIPLALSMEMMLENITTKPPINKIVEMLFVILSASISPKLAKLALLLLDK